MDGYLGWSLALWLAERGHTICGVDNFARRAMVDEQGSVSAVPIAPMIDRLKAFEEKFGYAPIFRGMTTEDHSQLCALLDEVKPDTIVHFAEVPSAPYSMKDAETAAYVMRNNVIGTLTLLHAMRDHAPNAHLVKLGTMGEYGTPNIDIPEGFFDIEFRGRKDRLPFPRQAGSWYHWSKVHDSMNIKFACDIWGLRSTDIMQGVVYGTSIAPMVGYPELRTRLDFDESFGTAINRFVCQAIIGHPLTVYGDIGGQTRGYLPLHDSMQCLTLAIENPPDRGEYRVFNQFEQTYSILDLANKVAFAGRSVGLNARIVFTEPPRMEAMEHYYNPDSQHLLDLGYQPDHEMDRNLKIMFGDLMPHKQRIEDHRSVLIPAIRWDGSHKKVQATGGIIFGEGNSPGKSELMDWGIDWAEGGKPE